MLRGRGLQLEPAPGTLKVATSQVTVAIINALGVRMLNVFWRVSTQVCQSRLCSAPKIKVVHVCLSWLLVNCSNAQIFAFIIRFYACYCRVYEF